MFSKNQNSVSKVSDIAKVIAAKDWSATPVGKINSWPVESEKF